MARNSDGTFASTYPLDASDRTRQLQMELRRILTNTPPLTEKDLVWAFKVCQARPEWAVPVIDRIAAEEAVARLRRRG